MKGAAFQCVEPMKAVGNSHTNITLYHIISASGRVNVNFLPAQGERNAAGVGGEHIVYIFPKLRNNYTEIRTKKREKGNDMKIKLKLALLTVLTAAAVYTGSEAARSLRPTTHDALPTEIYARYSSREESAKFFLKNCDGFVAVYAGTKGRTPETVTSIEISSLRGADRAMLERGIPVADRQELLELLEDFGS